MAAVVWRKALAKANAGVAATYRADIDGCTALVDVLQRPTGLIVASAIAHVPVVGVAEAIYWRVIKIHAKSEREAKRRITKSARRGMAKFVMRALP